MRQLRPDVFAVGVIDWDRRLFDELIPLPDGTSYNAYLIKGSEKIALLDTVDPAKTTKLIENLLKAHVESSIIRIQAIIILLAKYQPGNNLNNVINL